MNRKRYSSLLFGVLALSLILFGIPLKGFAYHSGSQSDLAANPELISLRNFQGFSFDDLVLVNGYSTADSSALKIDSVRWSALDDYYARSMTRLQAADADSDRWVAKGIFYSGVTVAALPPDSIRRSSLGFYYAEKLAKLQRDREDAAIVSFPSEAAAIDYFLAKLQSDREDAAMVSFPSEAAAIDYFLAKLRSDKADSARWAAMGELYLARGRDADSLRWAALGDQFAGVMAGIPDVDVIGAFHADEARLAALDVYFKALVARGGGTDVLGALYASRFLGDSELIAAACSFDDLANNPELSVARSYEDLASNPELLALQQYATGRC